MLEPSSSNNDFWRLRIACAVLFGIPLLIAALVRLSTLLEWFNAAYNWDARLGVRQLDYENIPSSNSNIIPLDHLDNISRFRSIKKLQDNLIKRNKIFLHPSGSLVTKIQERLSSSVAFLSIKTDAIVIALKINVYNQTIRDKELQYKPFKYLLNRLFSRKIKFTLSKQKIFDPRNYSDRKIMTNEMKNFYIYD